MTGAFALTLAGPVFTTERSAEAVTAVTALAVSFAGFGSVVVLETVAVFVSVPAWAGAVTTTVMVGAAAAVASAATVHVTDTFPAFEHVHPVPDADTNVTPAGSVSVTETPAASDGPKLLTSTL